MMESFALSRHNSKVFVKLVSGKTILHLKVFRFGFRNFRVNLFELSKLTTCFVVVMTQLDQQNSDKDNNHLPRCTSLIQKVSKILKMKIL